MTNPGATGKFYWTEINPKGPASEPARLVGPNGTLTGVTIETLPNGWGQYNESKRRVFERLIVTMLNNGE